MYPDSGHGTCITENYGQARIIYAHNYTATGTLIQNLQVGDSAHVFEENVSLGVIEVTHRYTATGRMMGDFIANDVLMDPQAVVWVTTDPAREAIDPTARIILIGVKKDTAQS
jgi:hypothetical protein